VRDLVILGAGVHAAEMVEIVERINHTRATWNLLGFVTPDTPVGDAELNGYPVLGSLEWLARHTDNQFVPDNQWPAGLILPPGRLASLVDPATFVSRTAGIGDGSVIYPNCFIGLGAKIGQRFFCLSGSVVNHHCVIEERVVAASGVTLAGSVHVEADCYLGQGCSVRQYVRIGRGSLIGMGAVVVKDVPPNSVMVGNPARRIRDRGSLSPPESDAMTAPERETDP
jgi:NDP-sugar pyrophosphorylase family protein